MQHIKKQIYSRPEIRRGLKPLWSYWAVVLVGAACGLLAVLFPGMSSGLSSTLAFVAALGALCLLLLLCFYLFGDSRFPYHKGRHALLEPTVAYYAPAMQGQAVGAAHRHIYQRYNTEMTWRQPRQ